MQQLLRSLRICSQLNAKCSSVGIALFPTDGDSVYQLLKSSDIAMYHAKEQGRNNAQFFSETMNALATERLEMENELRKALEHHELLV